MRRSVGVCTEEEQAGAMKRLEEYILMLQTYADESGSRPVMWWRPISQRDLLTTQQSAAPQDGSCFSAFYMPVWTGRKEWHKEVYLSSLNITLFLSHHKQKGDLLMWESGVMICLSMYDLSELEESSVSCLITILTPLIKVKANSSKLLWL